MMVDPDENTSESSAREAEKAMAEKRQSWQMRDYRFAIKVPVFGVVPLHPADMLADLKIKEDPPLWAQFTKYVICGFISTAVLLLVYFIARTFYGEYIADDLAKETLKTNLGYVMFIAFVLANIVAYITNRVFVFTPSTRHWSVEFAIFIAVSGTSFYAGNFAKDWFIDAGLNKDIAALSFAVSSALVNFIARKYIVFTQAPTETGSERV